MLKSLYVVAAAAAAVVVVAAAVVAVVVHFLPLVCFYPSSGEALALHWHIAGVAAVGFSVVYIINKQNNK